jgi:hypothetical protein
LAGEIPDKDNEKRGTAMKQLLGILAVVGTLLSGCAVYTPTGAVVVDPGAGGARGGGNFCPPGQAKKGNC